jgi:exosome complex RNA-binding protein Rrp42 (RNase PH superfamily)
LQNDPLALSNGSARILWTGGHVLCSCKAELVKPSPLHPNQGLVELHVDLLQNQQRDTEEYLTSTLSKLLVSSVVHLGKLCVVPSLYVWRLAVDVVVLDDSGGSVLDACSRVIRAALLNTRLPHVVPTHGTSKQSSQQEQQGGGGAQVDLNVDGDMCNAVSVPGVEDCPIVVTVYVVKCPPKMQRLLSLILLWRRKHVHLVKCEWPWIPVEMCVHCTIKGHWTLPSWQIYSVQLYKRATLYFNEIKW